MTSYADETYRITLQGYLIISIIIYLDMVNAICCLRSLDYITIASAILKIKN